MVGRFFLVLTWTLFLFGCSGDRPDRLGIVGGKFRRCPDSPNCVSSQSGDERHYIEPIPYEGAFVEAREALESAVNQWSRSKIVSSTTRYIHAEFTSALFRFVDDAEFYFDLDLKVIHVRSASRIGWYDFGVNRRRIDAIRAEFVHLLSSQ